MKRWILGGLFLLLAVAVVLALPIVYWLRPNALVWALDANRDHQITADELERAAELLRRLDADGDGRLTPDEFDPLFGPPGRDSSEAARQSPYAEMLWNFDHDHDQRLTRDELPERLHSTLDKLDANGDDVLDRSELAGSG